MTTCLGKSLTCNNYLLRCRQFVWENHSSGTSSLDREISCRKKSIKRKIYHSSSPPEIYGQMSIVCIKGTEICIEYKLHSLVVKSFVTSMTICTQKNSKFKALNHYTTATRFTSKFEVLKAYWVKEKLLSIVIIPMITKPSFYHYSINSVFL